MRSLALIRRPRYGRVQALRQTLEAAVRWGYIRTNPAKLAGRNRQPAPRPVRDFTRTELDAIAVELSPIYAPLPTFAAATGLRPEEWQALERRDIDRRAAVLNVRRTVSSGEVGELGKTNRSRRQVPLSPRALDAIDALPPRLDTPLLFLSPAPGVFNLTNFRNRVSIPGIEASGVRPPARIYDLRSTSAANALAAGITVFELARVMGYQRRDDRAPLRRAARRIRRKYGEPPGRLRGRAGPRRGMGQDQRRIDRLGHYPATASRRDT